VDQKAIRSTFERFRLSVANWEVTQFWCNFLSFGSLGTGGKITLAHTELKDLWSERHSTKGQQRGDSRRMPSDFLSLKNRRAGGGLSVFWNHDLWYNCYTNAV
jgi:hypothetical protein